MADITNPQSERNEESDEKNGMDEKKSGVDIDVEVVNSQEAMASQKSKRERVVLFSKSVFTKETLNSISGVVWKFARFAGPGAIISVAYVDPDNLQSNITSGAEFRYKLLFMILFSNIVAVFLQVSAFR